MSRYEVDVSMLLHYSFAIEANSVEEAQAQAFDQLQGAGADSASIEVHTELGADRG